MNTIGKILNTWLEDSMPPAHIVMLEQALVKCIKEDIIAKERKVVGDGNIYSTGWNEHHVQSVKNLEEGK